jgi:hypothetical protein
LFGEARVTAEVLHMPYAAVPTYQNAWGALAVANAMLLLIWAANDDTG